MTTLAIIVLIMGLLGFALMMLGYLEKNQALTVSGLALAVIAVTFSTVDYLGNGVMFKQDKYITINQKTEACLQYLDDIVNGIPAGTSSRYDSTENQCIFQYPNSKELSSTSFETVRNHFASGEPSEREHQRELKKRFEDIGTGMIFAPSTEIKSTDVLSGAISKTTSSCVEYVVATEGTSDMEVKYDRVSNACYFRISHGKNQYVKFDTVERVLRDKNARQNKELPLFENVGESSDSGSTK